MGEPAYRLTPGFPARPYGALAIPLAYIVANQRWTHLADSYRLGTAFTGNHDALQEAMAGAQWILGLHDDWDEEGSLGYAADTLERANALLMRIYECCWDRRGLPAPVPRINPADEGSIDLSWAGEPRLLINVPRAAAEDPTFAILGEGLELYGSVTRASLPTIVSVFRHGA